MACFSLRKFIYYFLIRGILRESFFYLSLVFPCARSLVTRVSCFSEQLLAMMSLPYLMNLSGFKIDESQGELLQSLKIGYQYNREVGLLLKLCG